MARAHEVLGEAAALKPTESAAPEYIRRARRIIDEFASRVKKADPERVPASALDNVASYLDQLIPQIEAFISNSDVGHLAQADIHADGIVATMGYIPALPAKQDASITLDAAKDYARRVQTLEQTVSTSLNALEQEIETEGSANKDAAAALDAKLSEITTAADEKLGELRSDVDQQKIRLDEALNNQQTTFAELQKGWLKDFADAEKSRDEAFRERTQAAISGAQKDIQEFKETAQDFVDHLEAEEERAKQIVGVTAASVVVGAYRDTAERERRQADRWRWLAIGVFVVLVIVSPFAVLRNAPGAESSTADIVTYVTSRLPLFLAVSIPVYATRQSAEHRRREERHEQRALELTSFQPFIASLPLDSQQRLIEEAQRRFFPGDAVKDSTG